MGKIKILKFSATWCIPCKRLSTLIDTLSEEFSSFELVDLDIEKNIDLATKYSIRSVPVLVKLDDAGVEVSRISGSKTKDQLLEFIK